MRGDGRNTGVTPTSFTEFGLVPLLRGSKLGNVKAPIADLEDFAALEPFFRIIEQGLDGLDEPGHFFDLLAEDITVDYVIAVPGYPRHIEGRSAVAELYRPYGTTIVLDRCFDLTVHHDTTTGVVVLEYASEGHAVGIDTPTDTSPYSHSATAKSRTGGTTSTPPLYSTPSAGHHTDRPPGHLQTPPPHPHLATAPELDLS